MLRRVPEPRVLINLLSLTQGGGRSYASNVLRELDRDARGFEFTILAARGQLTRDETRDLRVERVALPGPGRPGGVLGRVAYEQAILPLKGRLFDLVYCVADLAPAWSPTPTVVALRNLNIYDRRFYDNARLRSMHRIVRLGLRRAQRVVVPSRAAAASISRIVGLRSDQTAVVPHGISTEAFSDASPPACRAPYLFLPASLERQKNIGALIACLPHLEDPSLEAWIAGAGETDPAHAAELEALARRLGVTERVRFLGPVPYREILRYYRGARALVFPSWMESFGHPLLEAMAAGTPIVASDIPSSREVAGDAAAFFPPDDPAALARAVDALGRDPEAVASRTRLGRARAEAFSWKRSVDLLCSTFAAALGARRPPSDS